MTTETAVLESEPVGENPFNNVEQAFEMAWNDLVDPWQRNSIDLDKSVDLIDLVADYMQMPHEVLLPEDARESSKQLIEQCRAEVSSMSKKEFGEFFTAVTGREVGVGDDETNVAAAATNHNVEIKQRRDSDLTDMSIESFSKAMDMSTPLRSVSKRRVASASGFRFPPQQQMMNTPAPTLLRQHQLSPLNRSPKDVQRLQDQEKQLEHYEAQVADLNNEKSRLAQELQRAKSQIRELEMVEKRKDSHIQSIETDLSATRTKLALVKARPPSPTNIQKQQELIARLRDQVSELEYENERVSELARSKESEFAAQLEQMQAQYQLEMLEPIPELPQPTSDSAPDRNVLQQLTMVYLRQKQLIAQYSQGTPAPKAQNGLTSHTPLVLAGWLLTFIFLCLAIALRPSSNSPWWHGSVVHHQASKFDSWVREAPIS